METRGSADACRLGLEEATTQDHKMNVKLMMRSRYTSVCRRNLSLTVSVPGFPRRLEF
jgi:hypothetical protein